MVFESVFAQMAAVVGLAVVGGVVGQLLRQPLIVAFIVVGILLGPSVSGIVTHSPEIELFASLGIAVLLFVVGLKLDLHIIRTVGPVALASGLGQVVFTSVVGYSIALLLGMSHVTAIYVAVALTFSSTIIIVKLLSDKREVNSLHGQIAVGFLIVQDIVVVLVMIGLTAFGQAGGDVNVGMEALKIFLKGVGMLLAVAVLMRYVLPVLLHRMAHSSELLVLFSIAWALLGAAAGDWLGFSKEVGAFLAGISIASTPYREQVAARLVSLRDFLLLFFFINLGSSLDIGTLGVQMKEAMVFSLFVLIGNPIIVMAIMGYMGYRKRTGFLAGLTVAQISEFSLILVALGLSLGHVDENTVALITLVGLITISVSTYMILYSHPLYERLAPWLSIFERKVPYRESRDVTEGADDIDVLIVGLGRYGAALAENLREEGSRTMALDFDPATVHQHLTQGHNVHYGDAEDPEFIASLPLHRIRWVVSTVRDRNINSLLLQSLAQQNYRGKVAIATTTHTEALWFESKGADMTLIPYSDAAREAAYRILKGEMPESNREHGTEGQTQGG